MKKIRIAKSSGNQWNVICHATDCGYGIIVRTQPNALYWAIAHASFFHNVKL